MKFLTILYDENISKYIQLLQQINNQIEIDFLINLLQIFISDIVEYRLSKESLIKEISSAKNDFFGADIIKKEFQDHLNRIHTVIIFGDIKNRNM